MDKYEYRVKTEQMLEYMDKRQYKKAMEIADTVDWRRVKNTSMLSTVSEIYELNGEFQKGRDILLVAFDRSPSSRKIVYRLGTLALKLGEIDEASDCYEEFVKLAPKDPNQYILKYKILKAQGSPVSEQIATLSDFKKAEYVEKWAYELAKLYEEAGMTAECLEECDDLILWFSEGKYVYQAMELKMKYKPLTPLQQEKYDEYKGVKKTVLRRPEVPEYSAPAGEKKPASKPQTVSRETMVFTDVPGNASLEKAMEELPNEQAEEEPDETRRLPTGELNAALASMNAKEEPSITTVVQGDTLEEALVSGVEMVNNVNREEKKMMERREEEIRISSQMKIEDILQEWEEKQKANAEAIEVQRAKDEDRLRKEREALESRKEAERLEAEKKEAEEVARRRAEAEEKAAAEAAKKEAKTGKKVPMITEDIRQLLEELEGNVSGEADGDDGFDIEEELELAQAKASEAEEDYQMDIDFMEDEEPSEEEEFEEEEFEEEEFEEDEFEEEEFEEDEFEEEEFEEEELPEIAEPEVEEPLEIEEPSEEEIQKRIKKSKGSGVPFDTGFVVTGRYDLSATSEIGLKAGLTEEQKKLFSYFVPVRGMSEQIVEVLDNDRRAQREGTSRTGNLLVIGRKGSGKTVLAVDIVKAIQKQRNLKQGKVAIVTGESLNKKELSNIIQKLRGGAIIIEKAGKLNSRTIKELNMLMEKKTGEMLFVLEDQRKPLERILTAYPDFKKKFTSKLELPVFINDELVTFGQTYAKENGYKLDEMGILALYSRIDVMQREDHAVTVAEVKEIMDEAIEHSQKANVKHFARRMFGKSTDASDRIILKEEDFKI